MIRLTFLFLLSLASGSLGAILGRAACNADNCARAITGTRFPASIQALHTADCSSFMIETITPATPTTTITVTPTTYSVIQTPVKRDALPAEKPAYIAARQATLGEALLPTMASGGKRNALPVGERVALAARDPTVTEAPAAPARVLAGRQVTVNPVDVPIYASACSGTARYSSACSCAGITETTTYAPTPATYTATSYAPASVIPVCDPSNNYGYEYSFGYYTDYSIGLDNTYNDLSESACCAACFNGDVGCLTYGYDSSNGCLLQYETSGDQTPTDYCPYGVFGIIDPSTNPAYWGLGPCAYLS